MQYQYRLIIVCCIFCLGIYAPKNVNAQSLSAKKIYKTYKKKEGFKEAKIPRFLLGAARLVIKNPEASTIMKAIQKARVLTRIDKGEGKNKQYFNAINGQISSLYKNANTNQKNLTVLVKEKRNKVKEMAIVTKAGPSLHYVFLKGNMKKAEAEKFLGNLNKAGINIDKAKDKIFDQLDKLLEKKGGSREG